MHLLKCLVSSLTIFFWIFILGHIKLLIKVMTRILKVLSKGIQLRLVTMLFTKLMTSGMERTLTWIPVRALFRVGISWAKISLWRPRNFVSLGILYCIPHDSLAFLCSGEASISDHDLHILRPFAMKIRNNLTASTFYQMSYIFSETGMVNLAKTRSHVRALSRFSPVEFACCINLCICYTGQYADLDECPKCKTSRLHKSGRARRTFSYMPLIPHLRALMSNPTYAARLQYRADEHAKTRVPGTITDIFDGIHYRSLLGERVVFGDQSLPHNYFSDHHDIALGFATDGFAPFKKRNHTTAWILLFNYNLPPDERFQKDNILCAGIIPGPKK